MPNLICTNKDCPEQGKQVFKHKLQLIVDEQGNSKPVKDIFCCVCGLILSLEQKTVKPSEISVGVGSFKSMSPSEKKAMLKKRANKDYEANHKKDTNRKRQETINTIKQSIENP